MDIIPRETAGKDEIEYRKYWRKLKKDFGSFEDAKDLTVQLIYDQDKKIAYLVTLKKPKVEKCSFVVPLKFDFRFFNLIGSLSKASCEPKQLKKLPEEIQAMLLDPKKLYDRTEVLLKMAEEEYEEELRLEEEEEERLRIAEEKEDEKHDRKLWREAQKISNTFTGRYLEIQAIWNKRKCVAWLVTVRKPKIKKFNFVVPNDFDFLLFGSKSEFFEAISQPILLKDLPEEIQEDILSGDSKEKRDKIKNLMLEYKI